MEQAYIMMDVGGTQIKSAVVDREGRLCGELLYSPSCARQEKHDIFDNFAHIIKRLSEREKISEILGIGMAFPGPFDYDRGISLMKGLDKYDSIYGLPIAEAVRKRCSSMELGRFCFLHDVKAFALGEYEYGKARGSGRMLCLCIGTGAGSAFVRNGKVLEQEEPGVPENGWIYQTPYRDSVIDDYLSVRGLKQICQEVAGEEWNGKELYDLCMVGDERAHRVYRRFGFDVKEALLPYIEQFCPDTMVFGGQISKSFPFFGEELAIVCREKNIRICLEADTSLRAIQGLFVTMNKEGKLC